MKFRTGLVVGLGIGYVLGAKAGRERYEQIASCWSTVAGTEGVQRMASKGKAVVDLTATAARDAIGNGLREASHRVRHAADGH